MNFYNYALCHTCKKPNPNLRKCGHCKLLHYCSREHQLQDWPSHKKLCKVITKTLKCLELPDNCSAREMNELKVSQCIVWHLEMGRDLVDFENDMWMFPKICDVCYSKNVQVVCDVCLSVAYCSKEHQQLHKESHDKFCEQLKLHLDIKLKLFNEPHLGSASYWLYFTFKKLMSFPENIAQVLRAMHNCIIELDCIRNPLESIIVSDVFCSALTILNVLVEIKYVTYRTTRKPQLVIHVVGPSVINDQTEWEFVGEYLSHWIINLRSVDIFIISPHRETQTRHIRVLCLGCAEKRFLASLHTFRGDYTTYKHSIPHPDLVVLFKISGSSILHAETEIAYKANILNCIVDETVMILTAFTENDINEEIAKIPPSRIEFLLEPQLNPYASMKPVRNYDVGFDPVLYRHKYFAVFVANELE